MRIILSLKYCLYNEGKHYDKAFHTNILKNFSRSLNSIQFKIFKELRSDEYKLKSIIIILLCLLCIVDYFVNQKNGYFYMLFKTSLPFVRCLEIGIDLIQNLRA
jgi:hypothetical protein